MARARARHPLAWIPRAVVVAFLAWMVLGGIQAALGVVVAREEERLRARAGPPTVVRTGDERRTTPAVEARLRNRSGGVRDAR